MKLKIDDEFMQLENEILSIYDARISGGFSEDGNLYCVYRNFFSKEKYAITRETEKRELQLGYTLESGETAVFKGEVVRGMEPEEVLAYNTGTDFSYVDLWGNIKKEIMEDDEYVYY